MLIWRGLFICTAEATVKADKREEHGITSSLPNTATNTFNLLFIGLMLVVIGGIAFIIFNRRKVKMN